MPRDLKEPEGCRFSSLRYIWQLACLESVAEWIRGVSRHGRGRAGVWDGCGCGGCGGCGGEGMVMMVDRLVGGM